MSVGWLSYPSAPLIDSTRHSNSPWVYCYAELVCSQRATEFMAPTHGGMSRI